MAPARAKRERLLRELDDLKARRRKQTEEWTRKISEARETYETSRQRRTEIYEQLDEKHASYKLK